jgi:hypothetical protein
LTRRFRHCVECPQCHTRYVMGFSPYDNGSYLTALHHELTEEWVLYCSCAAPIVSSRWRYDELRFYAVSNSAYRRGYGCASEIVMARANHHVTNATGGGSLRVEPFWRRVWAGEAGK